MCHIKFESDRLTIDTSTYGGGNMTNRRLGTQTAIKLAETAALYRPTSEYLFDAFYSF